MVEVGGREGRAGVTDYAVYVLPEAFKQMRQLPGNVRQRVRHAIDELTSEPRPAHSKQLDAPGFSSELRRLRLDKWRIVYAVEEADRIVDVIAVRKRPPYDYGDLPELLASLE